jgi:SNF2-related domain
LSILNIITVDYEPKTRRLLVRAPFHLVDVIRGFPSRRFMNKGAIWQVPLTKQNVGHFQEIRERYQFDCTPVADFAIRDFEKLTAKVVKWPFPVHIYDFKRSLTGFTPKPHQLRMLDESWSLDASMWFAQMGVGKTFAAIHLVCARFQAGLIDAVVVVCPATLRYTWIKEIEKYRTNEVDVFIHENSTKYRNWMDVYVRGTCLPVLLVSVEGLGISKALADSVLDFYPGRQTQLIVDESTRVGNYDAQRTKVTIKLGEHAKYRLALNGTPIMKGLENLWSQFEVIDPNIIGSGDFWSFKTRYVVD